MEKKLHPLSPRSNFVPLDQRQFHPTTTLRYLQTAYWKVDDLVMVRKEANWKSTPYLCLSVTFKLGKNSQVELKIYKLFAGAAKL